MQKCTIYDIAQKANVSASTVSRVINNFPYVKKATRDRVLEVLRECNYVPDEAARSLVTQASKMVGFLLADIRTTHHTDAVFYLERELTKRDYCCIIFNTGSEECEMTKYIRLLSQRNVDAAILIGSIYQTEAVKQAILQYLPTTPVMFLNGYLEAPNIYGLIVDEENGVYNCVKMLAQKGRKCQAFIVDKYTPSNLLKIKGFKSGMERYCGGSRLVVLKCDDENYDAYAATVKLLDEYPEADGIIYSEDLLAVAGIRALTDMKLTIPDSVAVVGINNSQYAVNSIPALTSLDNMLYDMSKMLIRNLIFVQKNREVAKRITIPTKIVEREST